MHSLWRLPAVLLVPTTLWAFQQQRAAPPRQPSELERAAEEFKTLTRDMGLRADSPHKATLKAGVKNAWHGRVFENFRNNVLDAVPHEVSQRGGQHDILKRNQFGFNAGGPLVIPKLYNGSRKTFFNVSYEGVREHIGRSYLRTVAIAPERAGNFSQTVDNSGVELKIYDPLSTRPNPAWNSRQPVSVDNLENARDQFPGNRIPVSRLDPVAMRSVALYPLANANAGPFFRNNYFVFAPEVNQADGMIFKLDHAVGERHRITGTASYTNGLAQAPRYFDTIADSGANDRLYNARRATVDWTFSRNASTVNTVTLDAPIDRAVSSRPDQQGAAAAIGLRGPLKGAFPVFQFAEYVPMGRPNPDSVSSHNYYYLTDGLALREGTHRLRATGQFRRFLVNAYLPPYPAGFFRFGTGLTSLPGIVNTGHSFASFLLGDAEAAQASATDNPSYWRGTYSSLGLRDNYEYTRGLSFSGGVTVEISNPRTEKYDRFSSVSLSAINPANGLPGALVFAGRNGQGRSLQPTTVRPALSLGMAWNPRGDSRSVVRLSYGLSCGTIPIYTTQWGTQGINGTPNFISPNIQLEPAVVLSKGLPSLPQVLPDYRSDAANQTVAALVDSSGALPFYQSASLSLERQLPSQVIVAVTLAHARGQRLFVNTANPNAVPLANLVYRDQLNDEAFRATLRPFPQYQRFDVHSSSPTGDYKRNAAALRIEKRSSSGLTLTSTYEFSKQMDDYSGPFGVQDYYNKKSEWALTSSNNPQRFSLSFSWDLPIGSRKPILAFKDWRRYLVDGWSVSGITSLQSGEPLALRPLFNNTGGLIDSLRVNIVPGVEPGVSDRSPQQWFNAAAFDQPADFTAGNGPRTHPHLLTPGNQNHDLSVTKHVALSQESAVEFSATGFNFTNTGNWTDPDMLIGPASAPNLNAGKIIGSRGGRVIQLGMRFSF